LRILARINGYPPVQNAGAEMTAHGLLRWFVERGHEALVVSVDPSAARTGVFESIPVVMDPGFNRRWAFDWADVVYTHLGASSEAVQWARTTGTPVVHYAHNHVSLREEGVRVADADLVVANSSWVQAALQFAWESMVVHPPLPDELAPRAVDTPRDCVTLVNLSRLKGAELFWKLVDVEPARKFLAVRGGWDSQLVPADLPTNVRLLENEPEMASRVYGRSRVVIMPSSYESWGRVAIEAMCQGIPVIAHPTHGLVESLGGAGRFVERDDLAGYREALSDLDDEEVYREASARALARADELRALVERQLLDLEARLLAMIA
jgi:glycosyltransferase involved in cell wall biosynthesis